jgi:hypothetical protein
MAINHQNNFATNLTSGVTAGDTTSPLNSIPTVDAPFYLAFDALNINSHYEVVYVTSKTATNVNHAALSYDHTISEEVRCVCPAAEMDTWSAALGAYTTGAWTAFTPSFGNIGGGASTLFGRYMQVGKTIHFMAEVTIGAGGGVYGQISMTLPVTISTNYNTGSVFEIGQVILTDASTSGHFLGFMLEGGSIYTRINVSDNIALGTCDATHPFTWDVGDSLKVVGTYEAA